MPSYYLKTKTGELGPLALDGLVALVAKGKVTPNSLVREGSKPVEWQPIRKHPDLARKLFGEDQLLAPNVGPVEEVRPARTPLLHYGIVLLGVLVASFVIYLFLEAKGERADGPGAFVRENGASWDRRERLTLDHSRRLQLESAKTISAAFLEFHFTNLHSQLKSQVDLLKSGVRSDRSLMELREEVVGTLELLRSEKSEQNRMALFSDFVKAIDLVLDSIREARAIDRKTQLNADLGTMDSTNQSAELAGGTLALALDAGADFSQAISLAALSGLGNHFRNQARQAATLTAAQQSAYDELSSRFAKQLMVLDARMKASGESLTQSARDEAKKLERTRQDLATQVKRLEQDYEAMRTEDQALAFASNALDLAKIVPQHKQFAQYRNGALYFAGRALTWGTELDLQGRMWGTSRSRCAQRALEVWNTLDGLAEEESLRAEVSAMKGWTLAMTGYFEEAKACVERARSACGNDPAFVYNRVRLMSCCREPLEARAQELRICLAQFPFRLHHNYDQNVDLGYVRNDGMLNEFSSLLRVSFDWTINYGTFRDDVAITNTSPFPITNVRLAVTVKYGNQTWNQTLSCPRIAAGGSYSWPNVLRVPRGSGGTATLTCAEQAP